jgi:hypothetical protein
MSWGVNWPTRTGRSGRGKWLSGVSRSVPSDWDRLTPQLCAREVIASSECDDDFGHHLARVAWQQGVVDVPRMAFVADGARVNGTIYKHHFSPMTGILDLMHALSDAWKAATTLDDTAAYRRDATGIWQGQVAPVIDELTPRLSTPRTLPTNSPTEDPVPRAITDDTNHQHRMNDPPIPPARLATDQQPHRIHHPTNSHPHPRQRKVLPPRDRQNPPATPRRILSDSHPLHTFWPRWQKRQTRANTNRKQPACPPI